MSSLWFSHFQCKWTTCHQQSKTLGPFLDAKDHGIQITWRRLKSTAHEFGQVFVWQWTEGQVSCWWLYRLYWKSCFLILTEIILKSCIFAHFCCAIDSHQRHHHVALWSNFGLEPFPAASRPVCCIFLDRWKQPMAPCHESGRLAPSNTFSGNGWKGWSGCCVVIHIGLPLSTDRKERLVLLLGRKGWNMLKQRYDTQNNPLKHIQFSTCNEQLKFHILSLKAREYFTKIQLCKFLMSWSLAAGKLLITTQPFFPPRSKKETPTVNSSFDETSIH